MSDSATAASCVGIAADSAGTECADGGIDDGIDGGIDGSGNAISPDWEEAVSTSLKILHQIRRRNQLIVHQAAPTPSTHATIGPQYSSVGLWYGSA